MPIASAAAPPPDKRARRNLWVLVAAQVVLGSQLPVTFILGGLTGVGMPAIAIGTALGGIPVYAGWVAAGAKPEWIGRWEFWTIVVGVNLAILVPLLVWSLKRKRPVDQPPPA